MYWRHIVLSTALLFSAAHCYIMGPRACSSPEDFATGFNCTKSNRCVKWLARCNGFNDCGYEDSSDEENCRPEDCRVVSYAYRPADNTDQISLVDSPYCAANKQCLPKNRPCEGACSAGRTPCSSGDYCFQESERCDGKTDCSAGDDEMECQPEECKAGTRFCAVDQMCKQARLQCSDGSCPAGSLACDVDKCLGPNRRCDGVKECSDGKDESDCRPEECQYDSMWFCASSKSCLYPNQQCDGKCPSGYTACSGNDETCYKDENRCDGYTNCKVSGSDERGCTPADCQIGTAFCEATQKCVGWNNYCGGKCLHEGSVCPNGPCHKNFLKGADVRCDGRKDCRDDSDEENCTPEDCQRPKPLSSHWCENPGECRPLYKKCGDGSCPPGYFPCDNHSFYECVPIKRRCDGNRDCRLGEDEVNCEASECSRFTRHCASTKSCIYNSKQCDGLCPVGYNPCGSFTCFADNARCNGYADCFDAADETGCEGEGK